MTVTVTWTIALISTAGTQFGFAPVRQIVSTQGSRMGT